MAFRPAVYFGWTPKGKRIHLGDETRIWQGKPSATYVVDTFCGSIMRAWEDGSMPPAGQVQEFCRNCFRSLAWNAFEASLMVTAQRKEVMV